MARLEGKVVIVTGGASGIGKASAELMAAEGARVVITDINTALGEATAADIGHGAIFLQQDVAQEKDWATVIATVLETFGRLDVLVNNAGVVVVADVEQTTLEQWDFVHAVGTRGTFLGMQHAIKAMRDSGGSIINLSSVAAIAGYPLVFAYSASKGAIRSMTKSAAVHCAQNRLGIRVNSIHPGTIATPMVEQFSAEVSADGADAPELKLGEPEDIGYMVLYLASDESKYISGSEFVIDNTQTITEGFVPA